MYQFEDDVIATIVNNEVHIEDKEEGNFKILGFKNSLDAEDFIMMGDLHTNDATNDYFTIMGRTDKLTWVYED